MTDPGFAPSGFWSGEKLLANRHIIDPFSEAQIDCNSYTLRMGDSFYCTAGEDTNNEPKKTILSSRECFLIPPGQFAYLLSKEVIEVPHDTMAFISMRTPIKFQGLINVSGFNVDPGYMGKLIYAVYNASPSPIQLCEHDRLFKIWFCAMDRPSQKPFVFDQPGLYDIGSDLIKGMTKEILSLQSIADKLRDQQSEINAKFAEQKPVIENLTQIWRAIILGVVAATIIALFTLVLTFSVPSMYALGQMFVSFWSSKVEKSLPQAPTQLPPSPVPAPK